MRNKVLPARALYRLVSGGGQQQQSTASSGSSTATTSTSSASTTTPTSCSSSRIPSRLSSSIPSNARLSRAATVAARRRQESNSSSSSSNSGVSTGSSSTRRRRTSQSNPSSANKRDYDSPFIFVNPTVQHLWSQLSGPTPKTPKPFRGIIPVCPPQTSLTNVALQDFFAAQRPLLEHQVVANSSSSFEGGMAMTEEESGNWASISAALLQTLQEAGHLSESDLGNTKFVMTSADDVTRSFPQRVEGIEQERFISLLDRLAGLKNDESFSGKELVRIEAKKLDSEQSRRKDIEEAVNNAMERGEDPSTAKVLGTEADLVILGEPDGPNPSWARGTASHIAQSTRAFEPPSAPKTESEMKEETKSDVSASADLSNDASSTMKSKDMGASIKIIEEREDDPSLLLSHAMVLATLPPALAWDRLVAKMDGVSLQDQGLVVDVGSLDAELFQSISSSINRTKFENDASVVEMDSTKRKRRKKMRKHKYRKLRKATRIERSRLKK